MFYDDDFYESDDDAAYAAFDALADDFDADEERAAFEREDALLGELELVEQRLADMEAEQQVRAFVDHMHALRTQVDQRFDAIAGRAGIELSPADRAHVLAVAQSLTPPGEAPDLDAAFDALRNIGSPARDQVPEPAAEDDAPARSVDSIDFSNREERIKLLADSFERAKAATETRDEPAPVVTAENTDFSDDQQRVAYLASRIEAHQSDAQSDATPDVAA